MANDDVLRKVQRCLALSKSSNANEAAIALRQAQALMAKHNLTDADLQRAALKEARLRSRMSVSRPKEWEVELLNAVAEAFGCQLLFNRGSSYAMRRRDVYGTYTFLGFGPQAQLAQYTADVLLRRLLKARAAYIDGLDSRAEFGIDDSHHWGRMEARRLKTQRADAFCLGWAEQVRGTVTRFALGDEAEATLRQEVAVRTEGRLVNQRDIDPDEGYLDGVRAAADQRLDRPVEGVAQVRLTHDA